jgi:hypothetical protein
MLHHLDTAEALKADVVISKPVFMANDKGPAPEIRWPVDDLIETLAVTRPRALTWLEVFLFTAVHLDGTLLGSSASNLYRAETLQRFPFPVDFGKAGDAAWGARHFADVSWAVTPEKFSTFLRHPDATPAAERQRWNTTLRLDKVLMDALKIEAAAGRIPRTELAAGNIQGLLDSASGWMAAKHLFDRARSRSWPWILNPSAWAVRSRRNRYRRRLREQRDAALALAKAKPNPRPMGANVEEDREE